MKKELIILRHAKSDWNTKYSLDRGRPLNKRGKRDSQIIGKWMAQQQLIPDLILCSPAKRATTTLENVLAATGTNNIKINYVESLYLASLDTLLDVLSNTPDSVQRLLLVGHNPGLEELVSYLSNQPIPMTDKGKLLTTANLARIEIAEKFNSLQQNTNKLRSLIRPKELSSKSW